MVSYFVLATEAVAMPGVRGLSRYMTASVGVGLLITGSAVTESRFTTVEEADAADLYLQGGIRHEVDEATFNLVHAHNPDWAWAE